MTTPDDLVEQIRTFLADAPQEKPHEGYRYGELLSQAAAVIERLRDMDAYNTDIIARFAEKLKAAEAERDALRADAERLRELLKKVPHYLNNAEVLGEWESQEINTKLRKQERQKINAFIAAIDAARREKP